MKKLSLFILILLTANVWAASDRKSQIWTREDITGKINSQLSVFGRIEFRYSNDAEALSAQHSLIGMNYSPNKWLTISPFFRMVNYQTGKSTFNNDWFVEYRPTVDVKLKWSVVGLGMTSTNRFERRLYQVGDDVWRFREKIEIKSKQKWTALEFQPYVGDDMFFQEKKGFCRNWFILGFDVKIINQLKGGFFYMLQSDKGKDGQYTQTDINAFRFNFDF